MKENTYLYRIVDRDSSKTSFSCIWDEDDLDYIAQEAAEYEWDNCDGWEWMGRHSELVFEIYNSETKELIGQRTIILEPRMTFNAR